MKNGVTDEAAQALFKALEDNSTLQSLHLSQNALGPAALDALVDMLNVNCTLRDVYLMGNPAMTAEYKERFDKMSNRFRKIYT